MRCGEVHVLLHGVALTNGQAECFLSKLTGFEPRSQMTPLHVVRICTKNCMNFCTHRKLQARVQLGSKPGQMQDAGLGHGAFAVPDLDVTPDDQIVNLQSLQQEAKVSALFSACSCNASC